MFTYYKLGSSFDIKAASLYSANIHCDGTLWTFAYADLLSGDILAIEQFDSDENDLLKGFLMLLTNNDINNKLEAASKKLFYSISSKFTIIPSVFFNKQDIKGLANTLFEDANSLEISHQYIPEIDSQLVFGVNKNLIESLRYKIGHFEISHHFSSLISTYKLRYTKEKTSSVFIQYHQTKFTLALFEGNKLTHFNVFDFMSSEDILYFTYYTMDQFDFSTSDSIIHIGGDFKDSKIVLTQLQKFTKTIYHLEPNNCPGIHKENSKALINTIFDVQCG